MARTTKIATTLAPIDSHIRTIRGQKMILDSDLAALYQVPTSRLNEAVRRNRDRFPLDFMFQLTRQEVTNLISQIAISSLGHGGRRKLPYAFTEHGIAMLSSVLNSERAVQVNIMIVRAFIRLREMVSQSKGHFYKPIMADEARSDGYRKNGVYSRYMTFLRRLHRKQIRRQNEVNRCALRISQHGWRSWSTSTRAWLR